MANNERIIRILTMSAMSLFFIIAVKDDGKGWGAQLNYVLTISEDNNSEIVKALEYYEPGSEKFRAMVYLLSNMAFKTSESPDANTAILRNLNLDSVYASRHVYDIMAKEKLLVKHRRDLNSIDSEYLVSNVEDAYNEWKSCKWADEIDFEIFCEYILPYNIDTEPVVYWRGFLRERYAEVIEEAATMEEAYELICDLKQRDRSGNKLDFPYMQDIRLMEKINDGDCGQRAMHLVYILRALGIPAALDFTPKWSNYGNNAHMWASLVKDEDSTYVKSRGRNGLIDGSYEVSKYYIDKESYPYSVDSLKKVAKIFRKPWGKQIGLKNLKDGRSYMQQSKDVTHTYANCINNAHISLWKGADSQPYLCVFNQSDGWLPICEVDVCGEKEVVSGAIKDDNVVVIGEYVDGALYIISNPHIVSFDGIHELKPDKNRLRQITLRRKYMLLNRWLNRWGDAVGTKLETSANKFFSNIDQVIDSIGPFPTEVVRLETQGKLNDYIRLMPAQGKYPVFSEIKLYDSYGSEILYNDYIVYAYGGGLENEPTVTNSLTDGRESTTFYKQFPFWVGIDISKCRQNLSMIEIILWNDENRIKQGCEYELFYFENGAWMSLGRKVSDKESLIFDDVPDNALLWLRNYSEGVEERVFTYDKNKQIWW